MGEETFIGLFCQSLDLRLDFEVIFLITFVFREKRKTHKDVF